MISKNTIYQQAITQWTATTLPTVTLNYDLNRNQGMAIGPGSNNWFSDEMDEIVSGAGDSSYDYNLFMVGANESPTVAGIHPYNQRYGFLHIGATGCPSNNQIAAHELGHGQDLHHTTTVAAIGGDGVNLMQPVCGTTQIRLRSIQWDKVNTQ